jgi:UDP-N-acetyl-2-amino-2-deoxyglucuronate dehydrogenase
MKKTRFAVVGCGDIASYVGLISRFNRKLELVACVDTNQERAIQFSKKFKIPRYFTDYDALLNDGDFDVVYLGIPHYLHYPMIVKAVEKNFHILCEKPITIHLDDAMDLCRLVENRDCKIGVNYQYRYDKACYALAKAAHKGELGKINYIRCNVPWSRDETYFNQATWHASKEKSGGGTLITQASHMVDIALWITNSAPKKVTGLSRQKKFTEVEVEDFFMGTIETENDCQIQLCSSMASSPERCVVMEVYGSKGTGIYQGSFFPRVKFIGPRIKKEKPPIGGLHAMVASLEGFRRWVAGEMTYEMPIQKSLEVLATVEGLYKAADSGQSEIVDSRYLKFC